MCSDGVISVREASKSFLMYDKPSHRLWQMLFGSKRRFYKEHVALTGINFDVQAGQTLGLVGRNGAGKSTLLSMLCQTLSPTSGTLHVKGKVAALLELGAGFNPELTGRENIDLCAQIYGLTEDQIGERRDAIIAFADIGEYIDRPVKTYSSGMFTRLGFSVVAHVDADILIVDEALAVGDAYFVQKCMRFLHGFREGGGTLIFVSHDMGSVTALCDRVIWLRNGGVYMDGSPKQVAAAYLADLYNTESPHSSPEVEVNENVAERVSNLDVHDARLPWINQTNLRNDIEVHPFATSHDFGVRGARFRQGVLQDIEGRALSWVVGGELVKLTLEVVLEVAINRLLIGFVVKDSKGQPLFGDNTHLTYLNRAVAGGPGETFVAEFVFRMPILPAGDYAVSVAVSDGAQQEHVMHQWIHDAMILHSRASSVSAGLVGIPMQSISLLRSMAMT